MALDFYDINDTRFKQKLFELTEEDLEVLHESLSALKRVSGIIVDPYKTNRIESTHIKWLASFIKDSMAGINEKEKFKISRLNRICADLTTVQDGFIAVGD